ncbi:hypothetical protein UlMin_031785 [Ulmus minor]
MICRKKVKFTDTDVDNPLGSTLGSSSKAVEAMQYPRNDAKTSEFAFFKKLKEDVGHKFTSHSERNEPNQSRKVKAWNTSREKINIVENNFKNIRSLLRVENATPINLVSSLSPFGGASKNSDKKACATLEDPRGKQKKDMEEYSPALSSEETHCRRAEVFQRKRQKLRRWVSDSHPKIDELGSKGYNIVSMLLSRLVPESNEKNNVNDQKLRQAETDAKSTQAASLNSDIDCRKLQWICDRKFTDLGYGSYSDDDAMTYCWPREPRGGILYLDAPYSHADITHHQKRAWESDPEIQGGSRTLCADNDSSFFFPFSKYVDDHLAENDKFYEPKKYLVGRELNLPMLDWEFDKTKAERSLAITLQDRELNRQEPNMPMLDWDFDKTKAEKSLATALQDRELNKQEPNIPMLDWDFDNTKAERSLATVLQDRELSTQEPNTPMLDWDFDNTRAERSLATTLQDRDLNLHPTSLPSWADSKFYAGNFSSSYCHNDEGSENSLPLSRKSSYCNHDEFGANLVKGEQDVLHELNNVPLSLSCKPNYFRLAEDSYSDTDTGCEGGSTFFSPYSNQWFISKLMSDGHHSLRTEALFSSGLVFDLGLNCLPISDFPIHHFSAPCNALDCGGIESMSSQLPTDEYEICPNG